MFCDADSRVSCPNQRCLSKCRPPWRHGVHSSAWSGLEIDLYLAFVLFTTVYHWIKSESEKSWMFLLSAAQLAYWECRGTKPQIWQCEEFLTSEECAAIRRLAKADPSHVSLCLEASCVAMGNVQGTRRHLGLLRAYRPLLPGYPPTQLPDSDWFWPRKELQEEGSVDASYCSWC